MKVYCMNEKCKEKCKGYAICTALMDVTECPIRKTDEITTNEEAVKVAN